jgi:hypothetical protein
VPLFVGRRAFALAQRAHQRLCRLDVPPAPLSPPPKPERA